VVNRRLVRRYEDQVAPFGYSLAEPAALRPLGAGVEELRPRLSASLGEAP
jgi:hypothetical protein